jgi:5'-deoxynucleotidase YfbR-like HD superfamily hydrolase
MVMEHKYNDDFIQTFSGLKMRVDNPLPAMICTTDIAHALSQICRFTGHGKYFVSVAQHSVLVSRLVKPENAMWGLFHDATEAYLNDIARPIKYLPGMEGYRDLEKKLMNCIAERYHLPMPKPDEIREADDVALCTEARDLGLLNEDWSHYKLIPLEQHIVEELPRQAEAAFLERYHEIAIDYHLQSYPPDIILFTGGYHRQKAAQPGPGFGYEFAEFSILW